MIMQVYLYACLCPRYICVTMAVSAVPMPLNGYGHIVTSSAAIRTRLKGDAITNLEELLDYYSLSHCNHMHSI